jgi:beta-phosphoglucomutase
MHRASGFGTIWLVGSPKKKRRGVMSAHRPVLGISGIVFDMDGVLVFSSDFHRRAFEEILTPLGIAFDYDRFAGRRTIDVLRAVFAENPSSAAVDEIEIASYARRKSVRARQLLADRGGALSPGCVKVLTGLAEHFNLALASSGSRASVEAFLVLTQLRHVFRSVLSGDDVLHAKPAPELFARSIEQLGLTPESCVVIEDSVAGVQAAQAAGATPIGFGRSRQTALTAAGASQVVDSLEELAMLLRPSMSRP